MSDTTPRDPTAPMDPLTGGDDTLADEVMATHPEPMVAATAPQPQQAAPSWSDATAAQPTAPPAQVAPVAPAPAVPFISGPAPFPIIIGLVGLVIALTAIISRAADLAIDWGRAGPVTVVGAGLVLVALGLSGMRGGRRRSDG